MTRLQLQIGQGVATASAGHIGPLQKATQAHIAPAATADRTLPNPKRKMDTCGGVGSESTLPCKRRHNIVVRVAGEGRCTVYKLSSMCQQFSTVKQSFDPAPSFHRSSMTCVTISHQGKRSKCRILPTRAVDDRTHRQLAYTKRRSRRCTHSCRRCRIKSKVNSNHWQERALRFVHHVQSMVSQDLTHAKGENAKGMIR